MSEDIKKLSALVKQQQDTIEQLRSENEVLHDRVQAHHRIRSAYDLVCSASSEAFWTMDLNLKYQYLSPAIEKIRGFSAREIMDMPTEDNVTPESMDILRTALKEELARETSVADPNRIKTVELEEYCRDGSIIHTEVTVAFTRDANGAPDGITGITRDITDRLTLRESENKYRLLAEHISDVIWTTDLDLNFTFVSPSVQQLRGYSPEDALSHTMEDILTPESYKRAIGIFSRELPKQLDGTGDTSPYWHIVDEFEQYKKDGSTVWTESIIQPIRDASGMVTGILGVTRDISKRKKTEQMLAESQHIYKIMTENVQDVLWLMDLNLNYTYVSPSMKRLSGFSGEEMVSMSVEDVLLPHSIEYAIPILMEELSRETLSDGNPERARTLEVEQYHKDGGTVWVEFTATFLRNEAGEATGLLGASRDITARKKADLEIHRLTQFQQSIIDNANVWLSVSDCNGTILVWNKAAEHISGYTRDEVVGHDKIWRWLYPDEQHYETVVARTKGIIEGNLSVEGFETTLTTKYGHEAIISWHARSLVDNDGEAFAQISLGRDITATRTAQEELSKYRYHLEELVQERSAELITTNRALQKEIAERKRSQEEQKRLEEQLLQAQKMEAIGRLAGGVAHDFNNLLTTISGNTTMATLAMDNGNSPAACLQEIEKATGRAANLVRQLLAFSRKQVIELKITCLREIINSLRSMLSPLLGADIELVTDIAPDTGCIKADTGSIEQVIVNLAVNARDAMPDGGKLILRLENISLDAHYGQTHAGVEPGHYVQLSVSDTGTGIDPAIQQRIFDPFFTTKEEGRGTGLGLSTVYGIVQQHSAHINVYSEPKAGTIFKILFPRVYETTEVPCEPPAEAETPTGKETILLVEDEAMVRELTERLLSHLGYAVIEACDGKEALDIWTRRHPEIDLVFTDIIMPHMNGPELASHIRATCPNTRILFASGYAHDMIADDPDAREAATPFIEKPYDLEKLARQIRRILDS